MKLTVFNLALCTLNIKIIMAEALMYLFIGNLEKLQVQISLWIEYFRYFKWKSSPRRKKMNSPIFLSLPSRKHFLLCKKQSEMEKVMLI